jgi:predicted ferric reductase
VFRRKLRTGYQWWRRIHVVLAVVAVVGTLLHVLWLNHLLRDESMRAFFGICAGLLGLLLLNRWVRKPLLSMRNAYVVDEVRPESPTVSTLVLRPSSLRQRVVSFRPGQFAWIRLSSRSLLKESHPFTIASGSHAPGLLEFTIKHAGDWTEQVPVARVGQRVFVDGPHGDFTVDRRASSRLLLVAAGVGITPMMSIMRTLADRGDRRSIQLVVGARTEDELLFREEIHALRRRLNLRVLEVLSAPPPHWSGAKGRVDRQALARVLKGRAGPTRVDVYICGPPGMVETAVVDLHALGVPPQRVHTEQFDMV